MSTSRNTQDSAVVTRGRGHGDRGKRGGGRGQATISRGGGAQAPTTKIGPSRMIETTWAEEAALKGQSFVIWLGGAQGLPQQITIHRPIGVTTLDKLKSWVATPSSDVGILLQRQTSEELARHERAALLHIREAILREGIGRRVEAQGSTKVEYWLTKAGPLQCGPAIEKAMALAKASQGKSEANWIEFVPDEVRALEVEFKTAMKSAERLQAYEKEFKRPHFETRGGPIGDRPQKEVEYLKGLSLQAARDRVTSVIFGTFQKEEVIKEVFVVRDDTN